MEEKSSSCWRLIRAIPERKRLPVRRCALLQEEVHVEPRVAIGAAPSSAPNADEHLRPSLVAFQPPKQIPSELLDRSGPSSVPRSITHRDATNGAPPRRPGHRRGALAAGSPRAALRGPTLHRRAPRPPWAFRPRVWPAPPLAGAARHELRARLVRNAAVPVRCSGT